MAPFEETDLVKRYEAVKIPRPMRSTDPDDPRFNERRDAYFRKIQTSLDLSSRILEAVVHMENRTKRSRFDYMTQYNYELWFDDMQRLAAMQHINVTPRFQVVRFMKYSLKPETQHDIKMLQKIDDTFFSGADA